MNIISIYNILNIILFPFYILLLLIRMMKGKENLESIKSRLGIYKRGQSPSFRKLVEHAPKVHTCETTIQNLMSPENRQVASPEIPDSRSAKAKRPSSSSFRDDVKIIWIHAASVGESMIAITIVKELRKRHQSAQFIITTGTLSSAGIINKWLPEGVYHEFTPLDNLLIIKRFHQYWQPSLGIFIESELWPTLLQASSKHCKLLLLNARLSDKSFKCWQAYPKIFSLLTSFFSLIATQSNSDFEKYRALGCKNLENLGNLKFANQELQVDTKELAKLKKILKNQKVFVASSTHIEDENVILDIICRLKKIPAGAEMTRERDIYPIIILRHPERRTEITTHCEKLGLKYSLKSKQQSPDINNDLYIVDSFGELGLFYSLSDIVFIGGSFKRGGHNLLEPAYFDNVIIIGPDMSNFQNIADEMIKNKAATQVKDADVLQEKIMFFLDKKNAKIAGEYAANAKKFVNNKEAVLAKYLEKVEEFLNNRHSGT